MRIHLWSALVLGLTLSCTRTPVASAPAGDDEGRFARLEATILSLQDELDALRNRGAAPATRPTTKVSDDVITQIREEGMNHSHVMETLSYLTDVIGPRLTGSPNLKRANAWTRDTLQSWGLTHAAVEPWGTFGRGWSIKQFSAQVISPQNIILTGCPKAWSPGFDRPITADVVWVDAKTQEDLDKYRGKLKGAIVLSGAVREIAARFDGPATRVSDAELLKLANADAGSSAAPGQSRAFSPSDRRAMLASTPAGRALVEGAATRPTSGPTTRPSTVATTPSGTTGPASQASTAPTSRTSTQPTTAPSNGKILSFLVEQGAALIVTPSSQGDGGTFFVAGASIPGSDVRQLGGPRVWTVDAPAIPPQMVLAAEDFNRLARMIKAGEKLKMLVDLQVKFDSEDLTAANTVAEIPGSDLKDEVVMLGAHMDSWHAGTGATDNGVGVAAMMEAVRILEACKLTPRRTIRIALWTGEEQGLFGSREYVKQHFGYYPTTSPSTRPATSPTTAQVAKGETSRPVTRSTTGPTAAPSTQAGSPATTQPALVRLAEYNKLSVYFNLDNGTGKIRGVYLQGNEAARPIFRQWLSPFADVGASTLSLSSTGGTDHVSFDEIGLPAFQFIQDPVEYWSRTHHANADVYDRAQADDLKQAATIIATFAYQAAMMDEKFPRREAKPRLGN